MPRHLLTDREVKTAKPRATPYRLYDGGGLALLILPSGVKSWQYRYRDRVTRKEQTSTLGRLDDTGRAGPMVPAWAEGAWWNYHSADQHITLALARELRDVVRNMLDPRAWSEIQLDADAKDEAITFAQFSEAWIEREGRRAKWTDAYRAEVQASIRNHLSGLDATPVVKITAAIAAPVLADSEARAPHMFDKVRRRLRAMLDDAMEVGLIQSNPLPAPRRRSRRGEPRHYPAVTALEPLGAILRAARASDPCKGIQRAHALLAFTAQRVGEIVLAAWSEFDLETGSWSIPRERMKRKDVSRGPHVVPLPPQLRAALVEWRAADGEDAVYVCPAPRDASRHITAEAIEKHYRNALDLAGKHSPHSWRSAFSTICRDAGKDGDTIEAQLDHVVGTQVASAYDRAHRLDLRRALMVWYERQLIAARDGATVHAIRKKDHHRAGR